MKIRKKITAPYYGKMAENRTRRLSYISCIQVYELQVAKISCTTQEVARIAQEVVQIAQQAARIAQETALT